MSGGRGTLEWPYNEWAEPQTQLQTTPSGVPVQTLEDVDRYIVQRIPSAMGVCSPLDSGLLVRADVLHLTLCWKSGKSKVTSPPSVLFRTR